MRKLKTGFIGNGIVLWESDDIANNEAEYKGHINYDRQLTITKSCYFSYSSMLAIEDIVDNRNIVVGNVGAKYFAIKPINPIKSIQEVNKTTGEPYMITYYYVGLNNETVVVAIGDNVIFAMTSEQFKELEE